MSDPGPGPRALAPFARLLEPGYRFAVARRNSAFDRGKNVRSAGVPVISIGNLSVGGTGKTPMVMHVARQLKELWRSPGIAMRGYGPKQAGVSDEQQEYADRLTGVPVVANPDRVAGVRTLVKTHRVDCAILDDGFQHRFLARDLDLVLVDATRSPFVDRCLPAGWLREPVSSLSRADAVVVTRADKTSEARLNELKSNIERVTGAPPVALATHAWEGLTVGSDGGVREVTALNGARVVAACAIGNPEAFLRQVRAAGAEIVERDVRRDHHDWTAEDATALASLAEGADALLITHKDWVKLRRVIPEDSGLLAKVLVPRLGIGFIEGARALKKLIAMAVLPPDDSNLARL